MVQSRHSAKASATVESIKTFILSERRRLCSGLQWVMTRNGDAGTASQALSHSGAVVQSEPKGSYTLDNETFKFQLDFE